MVASSPTNRCPGCGLIHYAGLWWRERRHRAVRYRPHLCLACQLAHRRPRTSGKVDWENGAAYPSGRASRWGRAGQVLGRLASALKELPLFGWLRRRPEPARKVEALPKPPPAAESGQMSRSLKPQPGA